MKITKVKQIISSFQPITINLTLENPTEVAAAKALFLVPAYITGIHTAMVAEAMLKKFQDVLQEIKD